MNNIYQTPGANLNAAEKKYKPSAWWKLLFFIIVPMELWSQYETFSVNKYSMPLLYNVLALFVYLAYIVCLFGLAFVIKIGRPKVWLCYLPILVFIDLFELITMYIKDVEIQSTEGLVILVIVTPLLLLTWWSVYVYSKKMHAF